MSLFNGVKEQKLQEHGFQYSEWKAIEGNYVLSPSGLKSFIGNRGEWYQNTVEKIPTFEGNKASTIGSCIHQYAEDYYTNQLNNDGTMARWKIDQICSKYPDAIPEFERIYPIFREVYLENTQAPEKIEEYLEVDLLPNIKLAGSYDALVKENGEYILLDYKTSSRAFKDLESYIIQLSCYCLMLELVEGIKVDKVRIVGIITTKEPKIIIVDDKPRVDFVKQLINDCIYGIQLVKDNPDMKSLLFPYNYFDMFNSGDDKKTITDGKSTYKELSLDGIKKKKIKDSVFG